MKILFIFFIVFSLKSEINSEGGKLTTDSSNTTIDNYATNINEGAIKLE